MLGLEGVLAFMQSLEKLADIASDRGGEVRGLWGDVRAVRVV